RAPDVREWLAFRDGGHHHHHHHVNRHGDTASAYCFTASGPVDPWALEQAVAALQASFGPDLLRLKGLVALAGHPGTPRVLHVVGHVTSPPRLLDGWPDGVGATRMVAIVSGAGRDNAPGMLYRFLPELQPFRDPTPAGATVP
ncbi:MAG: GTP-binding protein, partial [Pseudomonadota bacterium]